MQNFKLKFELFNLKLKTTVLANSESEAKNCVRNRVRFYSVQPNQSIANNYYVSAEFYGKQINRQVTAKHEIEAKQFVVNSIYFIEEKEIKHDRDVDFIKDFLGIK